MVKRVYKTYISFTDKYPHYIRLVASGDDYKRISAIYAFLFEKKLIEDYFIERS